MFVIVLFIMGQLFFIGVILAMWAVMMQIILPFLKVIMFLVTGQNLRRKRGRALAISGFGLILVFALLFLMPFPLFTLSEGVIWLPEHSHLRAGSDGFIQNVLVEDGQNVNKGQPLVECEDLLLRTQVAVLQARIDESDAKLMAQQFVNRSQAEVLKKDKETIEAQLERATERLKSLTIQSPTSGVFIIPQASDMPGKFVQRGDVIGYVMEDGITQIRAVVAQNDIGLVRERTQFVDAWLSETDAIPVRATIKREVPGGINTLPSPVLGSLGGGTFSINPQAQGNVETLEHLFQFDLTLPDTVKVEQKGGRVFLRFNHGYEPLAFQWYRKLRQLFLSLYDI